MSEMRTVAITGGAAADYHKSKGVKGRTRKFKKMEGGDVVPGPSITSAANVAAARPLMNAKVFKGGRELPPSVATATNVGVVTTPGHMPQVPNLALPAVASAAAASAASAAAQQPPAVAAQPQQQQGGAKKLFLAPKKKSRLSLAPPSGKHSGNKSRKIRVQLSGLKKRLTKAKSIHHESRQKPITEVRKLLEEAKLVKPVAEGVKSTVPDSVLRDIYKDYTLLRNRAL
jgi:hypothetical protein